MPFPHIHPWGLECYGYLKDIVQHYQKTFPGPMIVLHTGLDQAQSYGQYARQAKLADGTVIPMGGPVFVANIEQLARANDFRCIQPALPVGFNDKPETYLTFHYDGHYSPRGHQWLAKELAEGLLAILKDRQRADHRRSASGS